VGGQFSLSASDGPRAVTWRGQEREAAALIEATVEAATARGVGMLADFADYTSSVLYNGLGRHDAAGDAARRAFERDQLGLGPVHRPRAGRGRVQDR